MSMIKILAIDDKQDNLITLSAMLKSLIPECTVITARSGPKGIEKAKIESPDTILLDIKMPGMDGYEVCKKLKEDKDTRNIPVIMISAILTESKDLVKGLDIGADAYLAKPVDGQVLIAQVKTALRMKRAEDTLRRHKDLLEEMVQERTAELANSNTQLRQEIEERKQSDEALQKERDFAENLFNTSPVINLVLDIEGRIVRFNRYMEEISGYKLAEVQGKDWFSIFLPVEERTQIRNLFNKAVADTRTIGNVNPIVKKDGSRCEIEWYDETIKNTEGDVEGILSIGLDISEKNQIEDQLRQTQKMESVGLLAGGVAHDYNNMLSIITGYSELALEKVKPSDPLHDDLMEILAAAKRSTDITRQLLAFAREQTIAPKVLDLNDTIGSMLKMLRRLIGEDIDLSWRPGAEVWPVKIDPSQIDQILANLCVNARDAIADVGKVTIETRNISLDEDYCADHAGFIPGKYVLLAVSDSGCGIAPESLEKVFEPFFTTKVKGEGTGLGLSTVYGIIKQNNGFINVYSEPDNGTSIKIYIPRHAGQTIDTQVEITEEIPLSLGNETVLLVEDDAAILKLGKRILEDLGYTVMSAGGPHEAIRLSEKHDGEINLLITDVIMPEMNGRELSEKLQGHYPDLKILFMSGYTANVIAHRGVLDDGINFIAKPFAKKVMAVTVRDMLDSINA